MLKKIKLQLKDKSRQRVFIFACLFLAIILVLIMTRVWSYILLRHHTNEMAMPIVSTVAAAHVPAEEEVTLPGNVRAWHEAPIYARTDGYIKNWYVDIGDHVTAGQLLAVIETPELDAELRQAAADLNVVIAQNKLAQSTAVRWRILLKSDSVSKQETDEKVDTAHALAASVVAAQARLANLQERVSFERVVSPFTGTISARATDIGALINAGSNPTAKPLFRIVQTDPLRVYVKIPQSYSSVIKPKMAVTLSFSEHPGQHFTATLLKTAGAINPITRTLLAQFVVNNKKGEILAGGYTAVHFKMPTSPLSVHIPVNTLIFRAEGLQVATLDQQNHVVLKSITISRDFGRYVEVQSGITPGEQIILNPSDSIDNGEPVRLSAASAHQIEKLPEPPQEISMIFNLEKAVGAVVGFNCFF